MKNQFAESHAQLLSSIKLAHAKVATTPTQNAVNLVVEASPFTPRTAQGGAVPVQTAAINSITFISQPAAIERSLEAILACLSSSEKLAYQIVPDADSPLETLFFDDSQPWGLFWVSDNSQHTGFGTLYLIQTDINNTVAICENGQWVSLNDEGTPAQKKQQLKRCQQLIEGKHLPGVKFSNMLFQLYTQAQHNGHNPIQFLMKAMFSQSVCYHRFQESLFQQLESDQTASRFGGLSKDALQQVICKTLTAMLFKGLQMKGHLQAVADLRRLRQAREKVSTLFSKLGTHPILGQSADFQKVTRRYQKLMQEWAV